MKRALISVLAIISTSLVGFSLSCPTGIRTTISETICDGTSYFTSNSTYSTSGIYYDTLKTESGCDSIVKINLTVYKVKGYGKFRQTICQGDSIYWNGAFRTMTGVYPEKTTTDLGCDSVTFLDLTVLSKSHKDTLLNLCQGKFYLNDIYFFDKTGKYKFDLSTGKTCDSTVNLDLHIRPTYFNSKKITLCENETYQTGMQTIQQGGFYYDSLKTTKYGCDSILEYNVKVLITPSKPVISLIKPDTLVASEFASSYTWLVDKTKLSVSTQKIRIPKDGNYKVIALKENLCPSDSSESFFAKAITTALDLRTIEEELVIFPNPASKQITITGKNTLGVIQLIDSEGKILAEYYTKSNTLEIETDKLSKGNYILRLTGTNRKIKISN